MTTTRKTIRCSPISSKSDHDDAHGGNAPAAGVPPARLRRYLVYIAYSRFGARTAERDDKRHRVTDCLSDYYRKQGIDPTPIVGEIGDCEACHG